MQGTAVRYPSSQERYVIVYLLCLARLLGLPGVQQVLYFDGFSHLNFHMQAW